MPTPAIEARRLLAGCLSLSLAASPCAIAAKSDDPFVSTAEGKDDFYCAQRRLGYWFYCAKPKAAEPEAAAPPPQSAATQLDAITSELRELKAKAILEPDAGQRHGLYSLSARAARPGIAV